MVLTYPETGQIGGWDGRRMWHVLMILKLVMIGGGRLGPEADH